MPGLRYMLAIASGALLLAGNAYAADPFTLSSSSFKDGTLLPKKMAGDNKANPNCVGENVSPALEWKNPPAGTVSYALIMTDPEGRGGLGVDHWHAYGIPASVTSFAEGETSKPSDKFVGGKGTAGKDIYMGPCTPPGAPHHYTFIIVATDLDLVTVENGGRIGAEPDTVHKQLGVGSGGADGGGALSRSLENRVSRFGRNRRNGPNSFSISSDSARNGAFTDASYMSRCACQ